MWSSSLFPYLWTAASICETSLKISHDVHLHPRGVLPLHPQRVQDLPNIQGQQHPEILVMKNLTFPSSTFIQPAEFNALNHEKKFKFILAGIFVFIILNVSALFFCILYFGQPGALFEIDVLHLTGDAQEAGNRTTLVLWIFRGSVGVTLLSIVTSCAFGFYANWGFVTPTPNHKNALLQVNIPFNTLHQAITLGFVIAIVFNHRGAGGLFGTALLLCFFFCNREAKQHVALRLRQLIDRFTVEPIATIALAVRAQVDTVERRAEPSVQCPRVS